MAICSVQVVVTKEHNKYRCKKELFLKEFLFYMSFNCQSEGSGSFAVFLQNSDF